MYIIPYNTNRFQFKQQKSLQHKNILNVLACDYKDDTCHADTAKCMVCIITAADSL